MDKTPKRLSGHPTMPWYIENLRYITAVTETLNSLPVQPSDGFYLKVELVHEDEPDKPVGEWSDEISSDAWSFSEILYDHSRDEGEA